MIKRFIALLLAFACLCPAASLAELKRSDLLDAAFSMLEEGNIFVSRYNAITGAEVTPIFEDGMPYFFGGRHTYTDKNGKPLLYSRYPDYAKGLCSQASQYFDVGEYYLFGLDCVGYTRWIYNEVGLPEHPALSDILFDRSYHKNYHLYCNDREMPAFDELSKKLKVGDLLVTKKGNGYHVMMFIGTLRDFGFDAEQLPQLAAYLDYPLVAHCGSSFMYHDRTDKYLAEKAGNSYYRGVIPTDGGVAVSLIGAPFEEAPFQEHIDVTSFAWYIMPDGYRLTVYNLAAASDFAWYRILGIKK